MIGIYAITNTATGQIYIGRAVKLEQRLNQHRLHLRKQTHDNPFLQASYNKYGLTGFTFRAMIECRREDNPFYERLFVSGFKTHDPKFGFNLTIPCLNVMTHRPEAKAAISAFQKVFQLESHYVMTPEIAGKIALKLRGRPGANKGRVWSDEIKATFGAPKGNKNRQGKTFTSEQRARISATLKATFAAGPTLISDMSTQRKGRASGFKGRSHSEETKTKIGSANKGKQPRLGLKHTDEAKAKMSAAASARVVTDEARANMSAAALRRQAAKRST